MKSRINELLDRLFPFRVRHREQVALCNIQAAIIREYEHQLNVLRDLRDKLTIELAHSRVDADKLLHLNHSNAAEHRADQVKAAWERLAANSDRSPIPAIRPGQHLNSPTPK